MGVLSKVSAGVLALFGVAVASQAAPLNTIYINNATSGSPIITSYDLSGNPLSSLNAPNGDNGRGVVQAGNILYYTSANTNGVYAYNTATNTNLGTLFTVSGASGLATMAYDGTNFFIGDYSGTNNVYKYSPTGTLLATISLANCTGRCDGLEFANGKLISNRYDTGNVYDVYSLSGTLLQSAFITSPDALSTGIAFDGTYYYTDSVYNGRLQVFKSDGSFDHTITLGGNYYKLGEDLSVNYTAVLSGTPEPETWALFLVGFGAVGSMVRRRRGTSVTFA